MLKGGFRTLINDYDFKYTINKERINWVKSTFPHVKKLVEIVSEMPIDKYTYSGSIFFSYELLNDEEEEKFDRNKEENKEKMIIYKEYTLNNLEKPFKQNFFGGISFELLNDCYKNVDLYTYVDPTGDVDIFIKTEKEFLQIKDELKNFSNDLIRQTKEGKFGDFNVHLAMVYYDENLPNVPILNPYFKSISDFIFDYMLEELNKTNMVIENSVEFDINDYDGIDHSVKTEKLNFRHQNINNSNAKLVCYLDNDFRILRVQIVISIFKDETKNIDHLLEFLITISNEKSFNLVCSEENPMNYKISPISTLVYDNLEAYEKRKVLLTDQRRGELSHKPRNHFCRFIYLLTLFKYYPDFYNNLDRHEINVINSNILNLIQPEYSYYIVKKGVLEEVIVKTIDVIYAFYSVFENMKINPGNWKRIGRKIGVEPIEKISQEQESQAYNKLLSLFLVNASSFRKFSSKQDLPLLIEGGKYKHVKKNTRKYKKTHKRKNRKNRKTKKRNRKNIKNKII